MRDARSRPASPACRGAFRGELHIAGAVHAFGPNTTLAIPANVDHQIVNTGAEPIRLVAALSTSPVTVLLPDGTPLALPWPT